MDPEFQKRLLETFHEEAGEHLHSMAAGLLSLEGECREEEQVRILEKTFREFHSLKGAARAVNETVVGEVCHRCETILDEVFRGQFSFSGAVLSHLREAVSLLRRWHEAKTEGKAGVGDGEFDRVLQLLDGRKQTRSEGEKAAVPGGNRKGNRESDAPGGVTAQVVSFKGARASTVRTPVERLDAILYRSEEMLGLREETGRNVRQAAALRDRVMDWRKEWSRIHVDSGLLRQIVSEAERHDLPREIQRAILRIHEFLDWNREFFEEVSQEVRELVKGSVVRQGALEVNVDRLLDETRELLMVPFSHELEGLAVYVDESTRREPTPKKARLHIEGGEVEIDRRILEAMKDPFVHLLRNAIDHGLESAEEREAAGKPAEGTIRFVVTPLGDGRVEVVVADDGRGIRGGELQRKVVEAGLVDASEVPGLSSRRLLAYIFEPNFSTRGAVSETSGRGVGLAIVKESAERIGGYVSVSSEEGKGTAFRVVLPLSIARFRAVEVLSGGRQFLLSSAKVVRAGRVLRSRVQPVKGSDTIEVDATVLPLFRLSTILGLEEDTDNENESVTFVTMNEQGTEFALSVEELGEEREVVLKSLGPHLRHVRHIAGASISAYGEVVPVIHAADVARTVAGWEGRPERKMVKETPARRLDPKVLVVEDSLTARGLLKNILEGNGYRVVAARDGIEGLNRARNERFDLLLTDLDMPRLNGFELTKEIRRDEKLRDMPVVILTALASREDKERGMEAGADAYVVKSSFEESDLLDTIKDLLAND